MGPTQGVLRYYPLGNQIATGSSWCRASAGPKVERQLLVAKSKSTVEFALNTPTLLNTPPLVKGRFGEVDFSFFQNPPATGDFSKTS